VLSSAMTPDGRFVAFVGTLPGFVSAYLYVWDSLLSVRVFTNTTTLINNLAISPDGNRIAFNTQLELRIVDRLVPTNWLVAALNVSSRPMPRFSLDGNWLTYSRSVAASNQVFLYDIPNRTELLVSHAIGSAVGGAGHSDAPDLTPDGRFVAYRTRAANIVAGMSGVTRQIVLYDHQTGLNTLVSASRYTGLPGDDHSLRATFSADGQTLLLQSWASDLAVDDFNRSGDVLAKAIFTAVILPPVEGQSSWIYWPFEPGNNYSVQFKNSLDDPAWQSTAGIMTNVGNKVWFQDGFATNSQRFYRIQSN
jgi:Tol biopolymer transport system component